MQRHFVKWTAVLGCSYCICSAATFDISSEHYKLAVGQGECSTTISIIKSDPNTHYKVAVTADIGSSSLKADPKYVSGYDYNRFDQILERKIIESIDDEDLLSLVDGPQRKKPRMEVDRSPSPSLRSSQLEPSVSKRPTASLTGESTFKGSFDFLTEQLKAIDLWVVFLSHPDKDHINWLSTVFNKLSEKIKLMLIAGGEWFNTSSTEDVREVLGLIYNPTNKSRILPFFSYEDGKVSGTEMQDWLQTNGASITKEPISFCPRKDFNGVRLDQFHGTLTDLFKVYQAKNPWGFIGLSTGSPLSQALAASIFNKIYIWSLDHPTGNTNAQSMVWSHEVDDIGWTFVYTGDAEDSTFKKIRESIKPSESMEAPKDIIRTRHKTDATAVSNLIMMQGMHHGSLENVSSVAMELFCPNAIAFSSGNGASFAHPSTKAIQKYQMLFKNQYVADLWSSHILRNQAYSFAAFLQKGEGTLGAAHSIKMKASNAVFLCTNAYGTIKINRDGVYTPFNETDGYIGYYDLHAYEMEGALPSCKERIKSNKLKMSDLTLVHDELYQLELFRKELKDAILPMFLLSEQGDCFIISVNQSYALKAIQKTRKESGIDKPYIYFYVLKKLAEDVATGQKE